MYRLRFCVICDNGRRTKALDRRYETAEEANRLYNYLRRAPFVIWAETYRMEDMSNYAHFLRKARRINKYFYTYEMLDDYDTRA